MDYRKVNKLVNNPYKKRIIYIEKPSTMFVFIYAERHKRHTEIIDLEKYLGKDISNEEGVTQIKSILMDFNRSLRKGEFERTFVRAYRRITYVELKRL